MNLYKKITKEHLFIFLIILTALIIFDYFGEFNYTGLAVREDCYNKGYSCCFSGEGRGVNYFSLDNTCSVGEECWGYCEKSEAKNLITGDVGFIDAIKNFFSKLFAKKKVVGLYPNFCPSDKPNKLFTVSSDVGEGHASKYTTGEDAYDYIVCSEKVKTGTSGTPIMYLSSDFSAHVEKVGMNPQNYNVPIKVVPSTGTGNVEVSYTGNCGSKECLFSISDETSAHVRPCNFYSINVCVDVSEVIVTPPGEGLEPFTPSSQSVCGNKITEPGEDCDRGYLNSWTGACNPNCEYTYCGDNYIQQPNSYGWNEECEKDSDCAQDEDCVACICEELDIGGGGDDLGKYIPGESSQNVCGNGIIESGEVCDGSNLGGKTCEDMGYSYGELSCSNSCTFDTSNCVISVEVCDNGIDDDGDGIIDNFDSDCDDDPYLTSFTSIELSNTSDIIYSNMNLDVKCVFYIEDASGNHLTGSDILEDSYACVKASIGDDECTTRQEIGYMVKFIDCDTGNNGEKTISCYRDENCHTIGSNSRIDLLVDVVDYSYCSAGEKEIDLFFDEGEIDINDDEFETGDLVEVSVSVFNYATDEQDKTVVVKAVLFDINEGEEVIESNPVEEVVGYNEEVGENFIVSFIVPNTIDENNEYKVYVKAYEKNNEDESCIEDYFDVELEETEAGEDTYDNETEECEDGDTQECLTGLPGICSEGIQTCIDGNFGDCVQLQQPLVVDVCGNWLDDDCDGYTDCEDTDCSNVPACQTVEPPSTEDEDGDGLLDSWELQYFGSLTLVDDPDGDFDGDGVSNKQEYIDGTDPTDPDDYLKKKSYWWLYLIIIIILIVVLYFVLTKFVKPKFLKKGFLKSKKIGPRFKNIPSTRIRSDKTAKLREYVRNSLLKGFSKEQIKRALKAKGWKDKDIIEAFR